MQATTKFGVEGMDSLSKVGFNGTPAFYREDDGNASQARRTLLTTGSYPQMPASMLQYFGKTRHQQISNSHSRTSQWTVENSDGRGCTHEQQKCGSRSHNSCYMPHRSISVPHTETWLAPTESSQNNYSQPTLHQSLPPRKSLSVSEHDARSPMSTTIISVSDGRGRVDCLPTKGGRSHTQQNGTSFRCDNSPATPLHTVVRVPDERQQTSTSNSSTPHPTNERGGLRTACNDPTTVSIRSVTSQSTDLGSLNKNGLSKRPSLTCNDLNVQTQPSDSAFSDWHEEQVNIYEGRPYQGRAPLKNATSEMRANTATRSLCSDSHPRSCIVGGGSSDFKGNAVYVGESVPSKQGVLNDSTGSFHITKGGIGSSVSRSARTGKVRRSPQRISGSRRDASAHRMFGRRNSSVTDKSTDRPEFDCTPPLLQEIHERDLEELDDEKHCTFHPMINPHSRTIMASHCRSTQPEFCRSIENESTGENDRNIFNKLYSDAERARLQKEVQRTIRDMEYERSVENLREEGRRELAKYSTPKRVNQGEEDERQNTDRVFGRLYADAQRFHKERTDRERQRALLLQLERGEIPYDMEKLREMGIMINEDELAEVSLAQRNGSPQKKKVAFELFNRLAQPVQVKPKFVVVKDQELKERQEAERLAEDRLREDAAVVAKYSWPLNTPPFMIADMESQNALFLS